MQKLSASLYKLPVIGLHHGGVMAVALTPIINPNNLKILGWYCKEPGADSVLLAEEIRQVGPGGITVNDESAFCAPSDLARNKEIVEMRFELIGKQVKTKRHKLGRVSDFSYDDQSMVIGQLYVEPPLTKLFGSHDTRIIGRNQVQEVTDAYILVSDSDVEAKAPAEQLATEPDSPLPETA